MHARYVILNVLGPKGLKRHMLRHTGEKPYVGIECDYTTVDNGNLKSHMLVHLSHNEKPFACAQCDYKCVYKSLLSQQMLIHPYKCARKLPFCDNLMYEIKKANIGLLQINFMYCSKDIYGVFTYATYRS